MSFVWEVIRFIFFNMTCKPVVVDLFQHFYAYFNFMCLFAPS